jgi:uncharacterized phage protein (TIGR02218 family)
MKTASTALLNLLATRQFYSADLYNFLLIGGGQFYYCSGDRDIVWNSITWSAGAPNGPFFDRRDNKAKCHWKVGIEVDTLVFDVLPGNSTVLGEPFLSAVRQGVFDGAEMTLYRAFMPTYGNMAAGMIIMFAGRVAEIDAGRSLATFSLSSHLELLNLKMPRNLYQAGCVNTLFDSSCALNQTAFAVSGSVASATSASTFAAALTQVTGYFDLGSVSFTSGANSGIARTVKAYVKGLPGSVSLIAPFPVVPVPGDAFTIYPGCDKQQSTCSAKFNNLIHFRGFPYVPENSTAV